MLNVRRCIRSRGSSLKTVRHEAAATGALVVSLLALSGVLSTAFTAAQSVVSDQATRGGSFESQPCPFWSAEESARYRVECGKLIVPEGEAGGRRYRLQVAILRSHGARLHNDAIVVVPGGPGGHLVQTAAAGLARHPLQDALRQHRDIVLMDPRGTGYSEPGELCPESEGMNARVAILRLAADERSAFVRRGLETCRTKLRTDGIDPGQFNSVAVARDLESLRAALGYEKLNLIGLSWGTRVVLETMRRFPGAVRSAILYGPLPPDARWATDGVARIGASLERLFQQCTADARCRTDFPALEQELSTLLRELDAEPIRLNSPWGELDVDGSLAQTVLANALYDRTFLRYIPLAIRELRARNAAFVMAFLRAALGGGGSGGFYFAAKCFELRPKVEQESARRHGEPYSWLRRSDRFVPDLADVCDAFVAPSADSSVFQPVRSEVPTLIFAGEFDPATPVEYGLRASATLPNSHLLVMKGYSHDVNVPNPCTAEIRAKFLGDPMKVPDTACIAALPPLSFAPNVTSNAGVPRLVSHFAPETDLPWLIGTGLLLASLLAGTVLLPVGYLRSRRLVEVPRGVLASGVLWGAAATALLFSAGLAVALLTADDSYVALFGVPGSWGWLFVLPMLAIPLTVAGAVGVVVGWKRSWWRGRRLWLHIVTAVGTVAFVLVTVWAGMM